MKQNWSRKEAKEQHKQCNEMSTNVAKGEKDKEKAQNQCNRQIKARQANQLSIHIFEGSVLMDSGKTSTVSYRRTNKR